MRLNAYIHGSGGRVSDVIAATRQGMSAPSIYTSTPEMVEARDRRVAGVKFTPAYINRSVIYPLDNEARANLTNLYFAIAVGAIAKDAQLKLPVVDGGQFCMTWFAAEEVEQLGLWALGYTYQLYDYADRLHLGEVPPGEPWPNNDYNAPRSPVFDAKPPPQRPTE
jgi:hypothetical protein